MVSKDLTEWISGHIKAHPEMTADQAAELVERYVRSKPVLGHLILASMVDDGSLQFDYEGEEPKYKVAPQHSADQVDDVADPAHRIPR